MTWAQKAKQVEAWASEALTTRVFDPAVFDNIPIFDTHPTTTIWTIQTKQSEVWVEI